MRSDPEKKTLTKEEQLNAIDRILRRKEKIKLFMISGKTYDNKDELKKFGWEWNRTHEHWQYKGFPDDKAVRHFQEVPGVRIEEADL